MDIHLSLRVETASIPRHFSSKVHCFERSLSNWRWSVHVITWLNGHSPDDYGNGGWPAYWNIQCLSAASNIPPRVSPWPIIIDLIYAHYMLQLFYVLLILTMPHKSRNPKCYWRTQRGLMFGMWKEEGAWNTEIGKQQLKTNVVK